MTQTIILAAGRATRFNGIKKQMLPICHDQTIVGRQVEQCRLLTDSKPTIMVSDLHNAKEYANQYKVNTMIAENHKTTCNTMLSSSSIWKDRTVVLLGDVIYSPKVINQIYDYTGDFSVFGNTWELFAVSFTNKVWKQIKDALQKGSKYKLGKLRYMYKYYIGLEPNSKETEGQPPGKHFVYTHDWTRDIDMKQEYHDAIIQLANTHILDNKYV